MMIIHSASCVLNVNKVTMSVYLHKGILIPLPSSDLSAVITILYLDHVVILEQNNTISWLYDIQNDSVMSCL